MPEFTKLAEFKITKQDDDERKVWGIFNMATKNGKLLVDLHGDVITPKELQKAANNFVLFTRMAGEGHVKMGVGKLIDSIVMTDEIAKAMEQTLKDVGVENPVIQPNAEFWFGGFQIEKESTWQLIKEGEFGGFSIGGMANTTEIEVE